MNEAQESVQYPTPPIQCFVDSMMQKMTTVASLPDARHQNQPQNCPIFLDCSLIFSNFFLFCCDVIVVGVWLLGAIIFDWLALVGKHLAAP